MQAVREMLLDVIHHVNAVGDFDYVKFTVNEQESIVEAMTDDRSVIMKGRLINDYPELTGEFGMMRFNILQGFLNFPNYKTDTATVDIKQRTGGSGPAPEEMIFSDGNGQSSTYRFMPMDLIPTQAKFIGKGWQVEVTPGRSKMQEFMQMASILSSVEHYFIAGTQGGDLKFFIGEEDATVDRASVTIHPNVNGELRKGLRWDGDTVSPIFKLGLDENLKLFISDRVMMITMETPLVKYDFILPCQTD